MILNLLVVILILLITGYLANQGLLSALLALATATFSSILAMALLEPSQFIIAKVRPDYARGGTFLLLLVVAFSITRVVADIVVPKNIQLPLLVNRVAGGIVGFFTALVVVGSTLVGMEMLPLPNSLAGYNRFPGETGIQGASLGEVAPQNGIAFSPDRFVLAIWNGVSARALGGAKPFASLHPDLSVESYGYRNIVHVGSQRVLPPGLLKVADAWMTDDPKEIQQRGIPAENGARVVMVRTEVSKGDNPPNVSFDSDTNFRISATQIRLLTDKHHQYYPIGYLDQGRHFVKLPLDVGNIVDDYATPRGGEPVAIDDWIFQLPAEERPVTLEMKQTARVDLAGLVKTTPTGVASAYPSHAWLKELCSVTVTFDPKGAAFKSGRLYILKQAALRKDISSPLNSAYDKIEDIQKSIRTAANGWNAAGQPGVPPAEFINRLHDSTGMQLKNAQDDQPVAWSALLPVLLAGQVTPNGNTNLDTLPRYMENDVVRLWQETRGNILVDSAAADDSGKAVVERLQPGELTVVYTMLTDKGFYVWASEENLAKSAHPKKTGTANDSSVAFGISLQP